MQISSAAILLFGKNPQLYFPRARVRFIRYEGTEERVGTQRMLSRCHFEGNILKMITDAVAYLDTQIKEKNLSGRGWVICNRRRISEVCPTGNYCKCCYTSRLQY